MIVKGKMFCKLPIFGWEKILRETNKKNISRVQFKFYVESHFFKFLLKGIKKKAICILVYRTACPQIRCYAARPTSILKYGEMLERNVDVSLLLEHALVIRILISRRIFSFRSDLDLNCMLFEKQNFSRILY